MKRLILSVLLSSAAVAAPSRVKELVDVQGFRTNELLGYGLVVGLQGTGDTEQVLFTQQSVSGMLGRLGVRVDPRELRLRNVAAVIVTTRLQTFSRQGTRLDVTVSALGNARSLVGGTLLVTPLNGADGQTYALAQGPVQIGGYAAAMNGFAQQKNTLTSGRVPEGGTVERSVLPALGAGPVLLTLKRPDFTNATRIATAIDKALGDGTAKALDPAAVEVAVKDTTPMALLAKLEAIEVEADLKAKVAISERTGTVVMGGQVRLKPAVVAHGGLKVTINTQSAVAQPAPFSVGQTALVRNSTGEVEEENRKAVGIPATTSVDDLVKAINSLGASPRDLVAILQALKAVGALDADLEVL
ncbi:MAG: flagellar basal body P-ring protein FlgI [Archangiaceae bacterium]|nr:flagellar basal body P-ring protein FlgI [Archangiaceae bacterium]